MTRRNVEAADIKASPAGSADIREAIARGSTPICSFRGLNAAKRGGISSAGLTGALHRLPRAVSHPPRSLLRSISGYSSRSKLLCIVCSISHLREKIKRAIDNRC